MPISFGFQLRPIVVNQLSHTYRFHWKKDKNQVDAAAPRRMSSAKHFHVAGYVTCGFYTRARNAITGLATLFPTKIVATIQECTSSVTCIDLESSIIFFKYQRLDTVQPLQLPPFFIPASHQSKPVTSTLHGWENSDNHFQLQRSIHHHQSSGYKQVIVVDINIQLFLAQCINFLILHNFSN